MTSSLVLIPAVSLPGMIPEPLPVMVPGAQTFETTRFPQRNPGIPPPVSNVILLESSVVNLKDLAT